MSELDYWIALQRHMIAAIKAEPHRADLWAMFNETGLNAWCMMECLQRADARQGATMSVEQWAKEWRGMLIEQGGDLERQMVMRAQIEATNRTAL